jgi:arylsulfatase A-like enzyme
VSLLLTRRQFFGAPAVLLQPSRRPNVLVFMSDQESALLPGPVALPNRARVERTAVRFTSAFCNTPQCSAARSALLTGLEPNRTGVLTNVDADSLGKALSPSVPNVGSVFRAAGYSTGYFGKWHLGGDSQGLSQFGFATYQPRRTDEETAQQAAEWIRAQRAPWLAWVSVLNPHEIYGLPDRIKDVQPRAGVKPPRSGRENLTGKPSEQREYLAKDSGRPARDYAPEDWIRYRSHYCELVEAVDHCLGVVLDAFAEPESTIVVYTSDHGDALGEHGLPFKGPFMYEELISIPLLISAPGAPLGSSARTDLVTQADLAPTLASLAGLAWPAPVSGLDLAKGPNPRTGVFLEYYAKQKWVNPIRTIRTRRWKLNLYDRGNRELYDLATDPYETRNLAGQPEWLEVQAGLEKRLEAWREPLLASTLAK